LFERHEGHPAYKKTERLGAGVVTCLERGADLHMAQLMPLPLTVSCFRKIQIVLTFLVPAHLGIAGKEPLNGGVCVPRLNLPFFLQILPTVAFLFFFTTYGFPGLFTDTF